MARPAAYRLTSPIVPEDDLHESVAKALDLLLMPPAQWTCFPAGHIPLPERWAAKLSRMGLKPNWPDILVLYERIYGIELKRVGARLSKTRTVRTRRGTLRIVEGQREVFPRLEAAGMVIATCSSLPAVMAQLAAWGVPLRNGVMMR